MLSHNEKRYLLVFGIIGLSLAYLVLRKRSADRMPAAVVTTLRSSPTTASLTFPVFLKERYIHKAVLDPEGRYHFAWNYDETHFYIELTVQTHGWVGFGLSRHGGMTNSDIVIGWIDKQTGFAYISDRHAECNCFPQEDLHQDYELLGSFKNESHVNFFYRRLLITCDENDIPITDDTLRVLWAFDDIQPEHKNSFKKHKARNRGAKSFHLLKPRKEQLQQRLPADTKSLDFTINKVALPNDHHTLYWCEIFKLPRWTKHYLIKYEPIIQQGHEGIVHHMIFYGCDRDMEKYVGYGEPCFDANGDNISKLKLCSDQTLATWAIGGDSVEYPSDMGVPFFESDEPIYAVIEMHYDNPEYRQNVIDSSGIRLYFTPTPRPIEIGRITFGVVTDAVYQILPPGQNEFTTYSYCKASCTKHLPKDGINIIGGLLHTHLVGARFRLRHIRNGEELQPIVVDEFYDPNYQNRRQFKQSVKVLPGDEIITECVYNTAEKHQTVLGGQSTAEEMCLAFMEYYPLANTVRSLLLIFIDCLKMKGYKIIIARTSSIFHVYWCMDSPDRVAQVEFLGAEYAGPDKPGYLATSWITVSTGGSRNVTSKSFLKNFDWRSETYVREFQLLVRDGLHEGLCAWISKDEAEKRQTAELFGLSHEATETFIKQDNAIDTEMTAGYPVITKPRTVSDDAISSKCDNTHKPVSLKKQPTSSDREVSRKRNAYK